MQAELTSDWCLPWPACPGTNCSLTNPKQPGCDSYSNVFSAAVAGGGGGGGRVIGDLWSLFLMDFPTFQELLSPAGQVLLREIESLHPTEADFLQLHRRLSKRTAPELVRAALETVLLRQRAVARFSRADRMYFTRAGLEQASSETVSSYRAGRFAGFSAVADLCCGIGGDTIALAAHAKVLAIDCDSFRLALARENVAAYERGQRVSFLEADVRAVDFPSVEAAFCDPARRSEGRRHVSMRSCQPPLPALLARMPVGFPLAVKLAPGVPWSELEALDVPFTSDPSPARREGRKKFEVEFISLDGELKECVLWLGPVRTCARRATILPGPHTLSAEVPAASPPAGPPLGYLYDPDPAVIRAGLVADLARLLDARQLDPSIAFFTSEHCQPTPFARVLVIEDALPFNRKRLAERLRNLKVGRVEILRRGSAVDPELLRRQLRLTGTEHRILVLTRVLGEPWVLICQVSKSHW